MLNSIASIIKKFTRSLRFKLSFYAGLVVFLAVVSFTLHSLHAQEQNLINAQVKSALKDSEVIKAAIWNGMLTKDREVIRQIVRAIGEQEGFKEINIYDRRGVLHYSSKLITPTQAGETVDLKANRLLQDLKTNTAVKYRFAEQGNVLDVVNPLLNTPSCSTAGCHAHPQDQVSLGALEVKLPLKDLRSQIRANALRTYVFAFCLFILVSTIIGVGVMVLVSYPLERLRSRANKMAAGVYVPDKPATGYDSIAELSRAFEEMSRQINDRTLELDRSHKMYKDLFEKVPCYLIVIDRDYSIVRTNLMFRNEFGDQVGRHCFSGFKGSETKCAECNVAKTFFDGLHHRSEEVWQSPSGTERYVIVNTSPIYDTDSRVSEVLEMAVDVTRLEKLRRELRKKEQQYYTLLESVPCYLTVVDTSYKIAYANSMFTKDFGDCIGDNCYKAYKGKDEKCENCPVEKTFQDGAPHASEELWYRNGRDVHIVLQTAPITDENGQIQAAMELCTNITELKLLRNELATLGETIAGMSHAVKNILSGLEGGVYMVDSGLTRGKDERVKTGWAIVKKNVERVSELVKDILYASKEREPEYQECDPGKTLQDIYNLYEEKARAKGIRLVRQFDDSMGLFCIDPKRIHTAISNLVSNSLAACHATGRPDQRVVLSGGINNSKLVMQVTDNGCGIPEEVKQKLFRRFYSTKGSEGTGLGLVVTKKIIEEHGGNIQVFSRMGEGTSFMVEIPMRRPGAENNLQQTA